VSHEPACEDQIRVDIARYEARGGLLLIGALIALPVLVLTAASLAALSRPTAAVAVALGAAAADAAVIVLTVLVVMPRLVEIYKPGAERRNPQASRLHSTAVIKARLLTSACYALLVTAGLVVLSGIAAISH
jgi:hypothetical protein